MNTPQRKTILNIQPHSTGKYAVFRHCANQRKAKFTVIHDDPDTAESEAIRMMMESVNRDPNDDTAYYVVQVKSCYRYTNKKFERDL